MRYKYLYKKEYDKGTCDMRIFNTCNDLFLYLQKKVKKYLIMVFQVQKFHYIE